MGQNELGINIRRLLKENGMSQRHLADKVGVTEVSISRYIKGERNPRGKILVEMAKCLHTSVERLTGERKIDPEKDYFYIIRNADIYRKKWTDYQKMELIKEIL